MFYGKINFDTIAVNLSDQSLASNAVTSETKLINYSIKSDGDMQTDIPKEKPLSMVLTDFHVLILFRSKLKAICVLDEQTVLEDNIDDGKLLGITKDPVTGTIWVFAEQTVYRYKINNEKRNVWQIYLKQQDFEMAKLYAKNDPFKRDFVICEEAEYYFKKKK